MSLSRLYSVSLHGLEAIPIEVEVDASSSNQDKTTLIIVGLPNATVKESKDRVLLAIRNSNYKHGAISCTVNLAPGDIKKVASFYDLPIALGLLRSLHLINGCNLSDYLIVGELGLGGETRPLIGALSIALLAKALGKKGVLLPAANAWEAAAVPGIETYPIRNLNEAVDVLTKPGSIKPLISGISPSLFKAATASIDFTDIKGQEHVKRAMEIAAAGAHNIVLSGPPGSGKTMLAKAMIGIMPEFTIEEALETSRVHSLSGLIPEGQSLVTVRPFRSPHHTISYAGLIGGGSNPRPGEVSLAHNGILFLDEFPEFSRTVLEVLRQPLEDRKVQISRAGGSLTFPTDFVCVAAMNPCPCGYLGHPDKPCKDTPTQIDRYQNKISGPLWDRLDMQINVPALRYKELILSTPSETSETIRERVKAARAIQHKRFGRPRTNGQMSSKETKQFAPLNEECQEVMRTAVDQMALSARACDRLIRVARTIADLDGNPTVEAEHLMEAIGFRKG